MVKSISSEVGNIPFDILSNNFDIDILENDINQIKYFSYINRYLRSPAAEDLTEWEIIVGSIRNIIL